MRTRDAWASLGSVACAVALSAISGCGSSGDDGVSGANTGTLDGATLDIHIDTPALDHFAEATPEAAPEAAPDVETDANEAAVEAATEAAVDAPPEAEACAPLVVTCQILAGSHAAGDAGAGDAAVIGDTPAISIDPNAGTLTIQFDAAAPAIGALGATIRWIDTDTYQCASSFDVTFTTTDHHAFTAPLPTLPANYYDVCGGTMHVTDGCMQQVTDLPIYDDQGDLGCAQVCGPDQWKAAITEVCRACPAPDAICDDVAPYNNGSAQLTFDGFTNLFTLTLSPGAPQMESGTLSLPYSITDGDDCSETLDIPVTSQGNTLIGLMPRDTPVTFFGFCNQGGGTLVVQEKCGNEVSFPVEGLSNNFTDVRWEFTGECSGD